MTKYEAVHPIFRFRFFRLVKLFQIRDANNIDKSKQDEFYAKPKNNLTKIHYNCTKCIHFVIHVHFIYTATGEYPRSDGQSRHLGRQHQDSCKWHHSNKHRTEIIVNHWLLMIIRSNFVINILPKI